MPKGPGVHHHQLPNGRWRVRWRETIEEDGVRRKVERSLVVEDRATAIEVQAKVLRAIETGQLYEREAVRVVPSVATLDAILAGWLKSRAALGRSANTIEAYAGAQVRILRAFREAGNIPDDVAVPGTVLTRDQVIDLTLRLRKDLSEGTLYNTIRVLVAAWTWACDDPAAYPGIAPAPRDPSTLLPQVVSYEAAPAPTMAECDAVIRRLALLKKAGNIALPVAVIASRTGLRLGQVLALKAGDVNLAARSLTVSTGKSKREKAGRTVPLAPVLVDFLAPLVARAESPEAPLLRRRADVGVARNGPEKGERSSTGRSRGGPERTLRDAWEAATPEEVRREVWDPPNRKTARPDHAFRAAFQAHLVAAGVRDEVIDLLVGHSGGLRGRHYVDPSARWKAMEDAVATLPPIAWTLEENEGGEVIPFPA